MAFTLNSASSSPAFPPRRSAGIPNGSPSQFSPLTPAQDMIFQEVDVLLQVITPQNSHVISKRILSIAQVANDEETLIKLLRTVLDRATEDPTNSSIYLGLCSDIAVLRAERREVSTSDNSPPTRYVNHVVQPIIEEVDSPEPSKFLPSRPAVVDSERLEMGLGNTHLQISHHEPIYTREHPTRVDGLDEGFVNHPILTPKTGPNLIATLNTPAMGAQRHLQYPLPRPPSPPLTPPKTIRTRTSPSSSDIPTISTMLHSSSPPSQHHHPQHHNPTRVFRSNSAVTLPPLVSAAKTIPSAPPEPAVDVNPPPEVHSPPVNLTSIERWLDGVNDPLGQGSSGHSVQSIAHILDGLTPAYADTRDNLLACMDYADSKTVCYVACAVAEKATETLEGAVTCAKLCVELETALATSAEDDEDEDEDEGEEDESDDDRADGALTIVSQSVESALALTGDMFKRLLAIFCWQNFEFSWVPPSHRSGTDDHLVSGLVQGSARRSVVLLKFIGELFKRGMISRNFVHDCATQLLDQVGTPFEHISIPIASPPKENLQPQHGFQEGGTYLRPSRTMGPGPHRETSPSPHRPTSVSPTRHRDRRPSYSQHPSFSQQFSPPDPHPPVTPSARELQSVRRYAVAIAVFVATIGHELDRRSRRDVDGYLERMKLVAKKESLVLAYGEVGKVDSHLSYLITLRANRWRTDTHRGRRPSFMAPSSSIPTHQRHFSS